MVHLDISDKRIPNSTDMQLSIDSRIVMYILSLFKPAERQLTQEAKTDAMPRSS